VNSVQIFQVVIIGFFLLPSLSAVGIAMLPWPRHTAIRVFLAVVVGWLLSVLYTALIYNPAGIAAATSQGVESPEMRYDNNTIATMVMAGWMYPVIALTIFFLARWLWHKRNKPVARV
jgi:hypothetical protein